MKQKWKTYEEVAAYLLNQFAKGFGLSRVEGKQVVKGRKSGTEWEIDAKGVGEGNEGFIVVECRRYTKSKQSQEKVASLAYRITDTGAKGGIVVSPLGLQEGASKIATAENIVEVRLAPDSTPDDFNMQFLNKVMIGLSDGGTFGDTVEAQVTKSCLKCGKEFLAKKNETVCPRCSPDQ